MHMKMLTDKINKEWHEKNRMPKNASLAQRIAWHKEHVRNCSCRPMPDKIKDAIKEAI